jgi:hypothetical protein
MTKIAPRIGRQRRPEAEKVVSKKLVRDNNHFGVML